MFGGCRYLQFVKDLQEASRDNLAYVKEKSIKAIYDLLRSNPEQEALLLTALVDKLGDPSRKIASNVSFSFDLDLSPCECVLRMCPHQQQKPFCILHIIRQSVYRCSSLGNEWSTEKDNLITSMPSAYHAATLSTIVCS